MVLIPMRPKEDGGFDAAAVINEKKIVGVALILSNRMNIVPNGAAISVNGVPDISVFPKTAPMTAPPIKAAKMRAKGLFIIFNTFPNVFLFLPFFLRCGKKADIPAFCGLPSFPCFAGRPIRKPEIWGEPEFASDTNCGVPTTYS